MSDLPCDVEPQSVPGAGRCATVPDVVLVGFGQPWPSVGRYFGHEWVVTASASGSGAAATLYFSPSQARAVAAALIAQCDAIEGGAP